MRKLPDDLNPPLAGGWPNVGTYGEIPLLGGVALNARIGFRAAGAASIVLGVVEMRGGAVAMRALGAASTTRIGSRSAGSVVKLGVVEEGAGDRLPKE